MDRIRKGDNKNKILVSSEEWYRLWTTPAEEGRHALGDELNDITRRFTRFHTGQIVSAVTNRFEVGGDFRSVENGVERIAVKAKVGVAVVKGLGLIEISAELLQRNIMSETWSHVFKFVRQSVLGISSQLLNVEFETNLFSRMGAFLKQSKLHVRNKIENKNQTKCQIILKSKRI